MPEPHVSFQAVFRSQLLYDWCGASCREKMDCENRSSLSCHPV